MLKITPQNYRQLRNSIPFTNMPKDLADTDKEMDMYLEFYGQDKEITEVVDLYLNKVNRIINKPASCKPEIRTVFKDRIVYKDKIVKEPCVCDEPAPEETTPLSLKEKLTNPFVIGGAVAGLLIGKIF